MDAPHLIDEQLPGPLAPGVVGETKVRDNHGEELLVEESSRQVEPPA